MEADGFGVSVDLSSFFSDERARCWVWVPRARRVRWLAARLRRRLRLPVPPALLAPRGLLLPQDPLTLLQPSENLRAIPGRSEWFLESDDNRSSDDDCETNHSLGMAASTKDYVTGVTKGSQSGPITAYEEADPTNTEQNQIIRSEGDTLQLMKKRALALLNNYDESFQCTSSGASEGAEEADVVDTRDRTRSPHRAAAPAAADAERRRRRRVRRRPRRAPRHPTVVEGDVTPQIMLPFQDAAPPVLRNAAPRAPTPRLVRAVCSAAA